MHLLRPAALGLLLLPLAVPARAGIVPADEESRSTTALRAAVRQVVVSVDAGAVTVRLGRTASVQVVSRWSLRQPSTATAVRDGVLTVTGSCPDLVDQPPLHVPDPVSSCETDVVVTLVARPSSVRVTTSSGGVSVSGTGGAVSVTGGSGAVSVRDARGGAVSVRTAGGEVSLVGVVAGGVSVESGSGPTGLTAVRSTRAVTVRTDGGQTLLDRVSAPSALVDAGTAAVDVRDSAVPVLDAASSGGYVRVVRSAFTRVRVTGGDKPVVIATDHGFRSIEVTTQGGPSEANVPRGRYALSLVTTGTLTVDGVVRDSRATRRISIDTGEGDLSVHGR
jgi:hypothetical protein